MRELLSRAATASLHRMQPRVQRPGSRSPLAGNRRRTSIGMMLDTRAGYSPFAHAKNEDERAQRAEKLLGG